VSLKETHKKLNDFFVGKLDQFGATPQGVDYGKVEGQTVRFEQLVKVINPAKPFTVIDYGCGYGAMFDFLHTKSWQFEYWGVDVIEKMVLVGREKHKNFPNAHFATSETEVPVADYLLAGAIFNIKMETSCDEWRDFTAETLRTMDRMCSKGFSFNMLTKYSDPERMAQRPDLYYGDPLFLFDFCKRNFSRNVALLHDYGIYDFTILVRKDV